MLGTRRPGWSPSLENEAKLAASWVKANSDPDFVVSMQEETLAAGFLHFASTCLSARGFTPSNRKPQPQPGCES